METEPVSLPATPPHVPRAQYIKFAVATAVFVGPLIWLSSAVQISLRSFMAYKGGTCDFRPDGRVASCLSDVHFGVITMEATLTLSTILLAFQVINLLGRAFFPMTAREQERSLNAGRWFICAWAITIVIIISLLFS